MISVSFIIYLTGLIGWLLLWTYCNGFKLAKTNRLLWLPFTLCLFYLFLNMLIAYYHSHVSPSPESEESRFSFIDARINNSISAASSILVIALVVYSLTIKKLPVEFIRLMVLSFVFVLTISTPILWVPKDKIMWFLYLRDFQTVGFTYAIFLCASGIIMLLKSLTEVNEIIIDKDLK